MFERFTDRARRVLVLAQEQARSLGQRYIGPEHLLLGLVQEGGGIAQKVLEGLGITVEPLREQLRSTSDPEARDAAGSPPFMPAAKRILELSLREALQLGHNYIGTEHMLLAILREGQSAACRTLVDQGAELVAVRQEVVRLLAGDASTRPVASPSPDEAAGSRDHATLGDTVTIRVVRAGTGPETYEVAYGALSECCQRLGVTFEADEVRAVTVRTAQGPGLAVSLAQQVAASEEPPAG